MSSQIISSNINTFDWLAKYLKQNPDLYVNGEVTISRLAQHINWHEPYGFEDMLLDLTCHEEY